MQVYRRDRAVLRLAITLGVQDTLTSPLLKGLALPVGRLFEEPEGVRI